jgi:hypothetical protein
MTASTKDKEKVYLTRDEGSDFIWVWMKPKKGPLSPNKIKDCNMVVYEREDIDNADYYLITDFKKKFGMIINKKAKKSISLNKKILHSEDYKLMSNDPKRKQ